MSKRPINAVWALWNPFDKVLLSWSIRASRRESIKTLVGEGFDGPAGGWDYWRKIGYRCVRARIVVSKEIERKLRRTQRGG